MNFFRNSKVFNSMIFKVNNQEKYNKERFYGAYIHALRKYYEVSQKDLAKSIHVSNSTLCKMESGQQNMDMEAFDHAIQYFEKHDSDYHFNRNISKLEEAERWIDRCLQEFVNLSYTNSLNEIKHYLENEENEHSIAYFHYKIIESFYNLFTKKGTMKDIEDIINTQYFASDYYLAILYDLYGMIEDSADTKVIENQILFLQKAHSYTERINRPDLSGLIEYHMIYRYDDLNEPLYAFDLVKTCINHLQLAGSYRRILTVQMCEGILYKKLNIYTKAIDIYKKLANNIMQVNDPRIQKEIFDNFSWCEFMQKNDKEAIKYALFSLETGSSFPDLYIVLAFSNYRLGQYEQAEQFAKEFIEKNLNSERAKFIGLFMQVLLDVLHNKQDISEQEQKLISMLPKFRAVELEIPFYSLLIDYYRNQNNLEQVAIYQDQFIQYLLSNKIH